MTNLEGVQELLDEGADPNETDRSNYSSVSHAASGDTGSILRVTWSGMNSFFWMRMLQKCWLFLCLFDLAQLILAYGGQGDFAAQSITTPMLIAARAGKTEPLKVGSRNHCHRMRPLGAMWHLLLLGFTSWSSDKQESLFGTGAGWCRVFDSCKRIWLLQCRWQGMHGCVWVWVRLFQVRGQENPWYADELG